MIIGSLFEAKLSKYALSGCAVVVELNASSVHLSPYLMGCFLDMEDEWLISWDCLVVVLSPLLSNDGKVDSVIESLPQIVYYFVLYHILLDEKAYLPLYCHFLIIYSTIIFIKIDTNVLKVLNYA